MPPTLSRFELFLVVRNQVADRALLRRYLAVEAAMTELAPLTTVAPDLAALTGLGAGIDSELCIANPDRRGEVASEILLTEGAPAEVADAVRQARRPPEEHGALAALLVAAEVLVDAVYEILSLEEEGLDALSAERLAMRLERLAGRRNDEAARRLLTALDRAGLALDQAAERALAGIRGARRDLQI